MPSVVWDRSRVGRLSSPHRVEERRLARYVRTVSIASQPAAALRAASGAGQHEIETLVRRVVADAVLRQSLGRRGARRGLGQTRHERRPAWHAIDDVVGPAGPRRAKPASSNCRKSSVRRIGQRSAAKAGDRQRGRDRAREFPVIRWRLAAALLEHGEGAKEGDALDPATLKDETHPRRTIGESGCIRRAGDLHTQPLQRN